MPKIKKKSTLPVGKRLRIFCEGEKTEPNYINSYLASVFSGDIKRSVIQIVPTKKNAPEQLVGEAIKLLENDSVKGDVFWVVYDRESIKKHSNEVHKRALERANKYGINIAISNVCFEIWLHIHFTNSSASYYNYDDFMKNSGFKDYLKEIGIVKYDKSDASFFDKITTKHLKDARKNAKSMNLDSLNNAAAGNDSPYLLSPYTDMHLLLDAIDNF